MKITNFSNHIVHNRFHETATVDVTVRIGILKLNKITTTRDLFCNGTRWRFVDTGEMIPAGIIES